MGFYYLVLSVAWLLLEPLIYYFSVGEKNLFQGLLPSPSLETRTLTMTNEPFFHSHPGWRCHLFQTLLPFFQVSLLWTFVLPHQSRTDDCSAHSCNFIFSLQPVLYCLFFFSFFSSPSPSLHFWIRSAPYPPAAKELNVLQAPTSIYHSNGFASSTFPHNSSG